MIMNKKVSILGSTGSIGTQALEVCEKHHMDIVALAAHSSIDMLEKQARKYSPQYVAVFSEDKYAELKERYDFLVSQLGDMEAARRSLTSLTPAARASSPRVTTNASR